MANECFANPKFGIFVALVNILVLVLFGVYKIWELNAYLDNYKVTNSLLDKKIIIVVTLVLVCLLKFILCGVLIIGILKQNHNLMAPWLGVNFVCIVGNFFYTLVTLGKSFVNDLTWPENILGIYPAVMIFSIQICIFYPIYVLYGSILGIRLKRDDVAAESNPDDELIDEGEVY